MKKALVSILVAVMLLSVLPVAAFANGAVYSDGGEYEISGTEDGVLVVNDTFLTVNGDVQSSTTNDAVYANGNSLVIVNGNVNANDKALYGVSECEADVIVYGNVTAEGADSTGILVWGSGFAAAEGDVTGGNTGVWATGNGQVLVCGTVSGGNTDVKLDPNFEGQVVVGKLENGTIEGNHDNIFYIINGDETVTVNGDVNGLNVEDQLFLLTSSEGKELLVCAADGYTGLVVEGDVEVLEVMPDGTHRIKVLCGGGISFTANVFPSGQVVFEGPAPETAKDEDGCYVVGYRFSHFVKALVDGEEIQPETDYTAEQESHGLTNIKLTDSFLSTLAAGRHTLTVVFTDGSFDINFEV